MCINGTKYQQPFVLAINYDQEELKFGNVTCIYTIKKSVFFEFVPMVTEHYSHHRHAYALSFPRHSTEKKLINHCNLPDFHPYGLYHVSSSNLLFTVVRSNVYV